MRSLPSGAGAAALFFVTIASGLLVPAWHAAQAFNSEEHKVLVDLGVSQVVLPASIQLPFPTRFEAFPVATLHGAYTAAKSLAVGYASNNATWDSRCESPSGADAYPAAYDQYRLAVQDNSYWDSDHSSFNQVEGNLNLWIPPTSLVNENALWVTGYLDGTARTFTFGDLVSIYGDYRRTTYCVGGNCYLSDVSLSTIGFARGTDCYGIPPFRTCGYRPAAQSSDTYLKRIAAGLWPPFGCLGNALSNTANDDEYGDAGWWGDEMMRIANSNDWHFSSTAMSWYVGMHRLALLQVDAARSDPARWNAALHYEASALHSLTDLFCFGHIVTNRDETSHGIILDRSLTGNAAQQWMENVITMGGGSRNPAGRVTASGTLPAVADRTGLRNDFMRTYLGTWANWGRWEHTYHSDFNASGATVRNLRGDRFGIRGDGEVRNYAAADRDVIVGAVRTSLQSLFDAYVQLAAGGSVADLASPGSTYFAALKWIPVFVETNPGNQFTGQWVRYAGAVGTIVGSTAIPPDWSNCVMAYINGGENLPAPSSAPCATFPVITSVWVENLAVVAQGNRVLLSWDMTNAAVRELQGVRVQRADDVAGPYENRTPQALSPDARMSFEDTAVENGRDSWYRLELLSRDGSTVVGPIRAVANESGSLRTALATPVIASGDRVEVRFSLAGASGVARLDLYDVGGRLVRVLAQDLAGPGQFLRTWDGRDAAGSQVARGVYVVRLRAGATSDSKKLVLVRD